MILFPFKSVLYQDFLFMLQGFITQEHATSIIIILLSLVGSFICSVGLSEAITLFIFILHQYCLRKEVLNGK